MAGRSEEAWAYYRERGPETIGDGRVIVRALKLLSDGALGSRGAALHSPYCDDPENRGLLLMPADELGRLTREAVEAGTPLGLAAKKVMDAGQFVADDVIIGIARERLSRPDAAQPA